MSKRSFKELTAGMRAGEKLEYLWTYYKWVLVVAAFAAVVIAIVITAVINAQTNILFSGALVNVSPTEEGQTYLTEQWQQALGAEGEHDTVKLTSFTFRDILSGNATDVEANTAMRLAAMVAAQEVDYILTDDVGYRFYINHPVFSPLDTIFSPQELAGIDLPIIYSEDGTTPMAFDISQTPFAQSCSVRSGIVYIAFPGNTGRTAMNTDFLEYLLRYSN